MTTKKKLAVGLIASMVVVAAVAGVIWTWMRFAIVDFHLYPRESTQLDLRGQDVSIKHYEKLRKQFPGCEILWNVPFQGTAYPEETTQITLTSLTQEDVETLDYFPMLETVNADGCTDYDLLIALQERRPEVNVRYTVTLGSTACRQSAKEVYLDSIDPSQIPLLTYLPQLTTVVVRGGGQMDGLSQLQDYCHENGLDFCISIGGQTISDSVKELTVSDADDDSLNLLSLLPDLESVHLVLPEASAENLIALRDSLSEVEVTWEQEICGKVIPLGEEEVDLSDANIESLEQVKEGMAYFPGSARVFLGECGIDNEEIAAFREEMRDQYKVVWIVRCGEKLPTRTDTTSFMPSRDGVGYIRDDSTVNLRYCEDVIAVDVGHMGVKDVSFVEYMPNLKYLILAHTEVQDITPLSTCKNLIFLELDWSPVRDFSPLVGCTALEDLNIGNTGADVTPIGQMTWLKNLWMIFRSGGSAWEMRQALPNTRVVSSGNATVSSGWRNLPNYFDMRDALHMYYMSW